MKQHLKLYKDLFYEFNKSININNYSYEELILLIKLKNLWEDADIQKSIDYYNEIKTIEDNLTKSFRKNDIFEKYKKEGEVYRKLLIMKSIKSS